MSAAIRSRHATWYTAPVSGTEFKMDGTDYLLLEASAVLARFIN